MLIVLALIVVLGLLAPVFGADSRDGLDWTPDSFWMRRRRSPGTVRKSGSPAPAAAGRASADACRSIPAAG